MSKIALIIPYFGKYPNMIHVWIKTVKYNPDIDFLLFSDKSSSDDLPENLIWYNISFPEIKKLAQVNFDFPIWLETPYKLCDYKPAYGVIFKDYLKKYDFWGHCDPDIVWGDFSHFINDDILKHYDRIYTRGHLCIYRNNEKMNNLFRIDHKYRDCYHFRRVYSRRFGCDYDEWGTKYGLGISTICKRLDIPTYDEIDFADISYSYYDFRLATPDSFNPQIFVSTPSGLFGYKINNGILESKEYLYVHLQKRNMEMDDFNINEDNFVIIPNKFVHAISKDELFNLIEQIPKHKFYLEWYKKRIKRVFTKISEGALSELIYRKLCIHGIIRYKG